MFNKFFGNTEQKQTTVFQELTCLNRGDCLEWELFGSQFVGNLTTLYDSLRVTNTLWQWVNKRLENMKGIQPVFNLHVSTVNYNV